MTIKTRPTGPLNFLEETGYGSVLTEGHVRDTKGPFAGTFIPMISKTVIIRGPSLYSPH